MGDKPSVKPDYAILCDDIRQEQNGKLILIGVYSGDILLREFPGKLNIALLLHGSISADCAVTLEIKYRGDFENADPYEVTAKGDIQAWQVEGSGEFYVPVPGVPFEFRNTGYLAISCRVDDRKWKTVIKKKIKLSDS